MIARKGCLLVLCAALSHAIALGQWKPQAGPLRTRWAQDVSPANVHAEYPRPQMVREVWQNLNGLWDYAIQPKEGDRPSEFAGKILVPFPVESALSGVMQRMDAEHRLWYRRTFSIPGAWAGQRVRLHFGAVDWEATVWVNGKELGRHQGGYDPFSFDITEALTKTGEQEIVLAVWDPTDSGFQPRGKQVQKPHGIWYTPTTGIWQTVWLEPVPQTYIETLDIVPDASASTVAVRAKLSGGGEKGTIRVTVLDGDTTVAAVDTAPDAVAKISIPSPKLWQPGTPFLYGLVVAVRRDDAEIDRVTSYFGMRSVSVGKDEKGITRLMLNGKVLFMLGPLDQGFWPDGLYTAPTDEALRYDLEMTQKLGFNMIRKHVKVEPERWYYWCDKLGLLVWQDMPSGDLQESKEPEIARSKESGEDFERELKNIMAARVNHPCIVMWVPYNEGWGQWETARIVEQVRRWDPTRLVDCASGWTDMGVGDVHDVHSYPGPDSPAPEPKRAAVLGEFGGLGLPVSGHTWQSEKNWGYRKFQSAEELTTAYVDLLERLRLLIGETGLSAAVYTQTTDVETEVNGLMTYDRAMVKMDAERIAAANRKAYGPPPKVATILPTSQAQGGVWRYTTTQPAEDWYAPDFGDTQWQQGPGGFGTQGTPGIIVRTEWKTGDIWLRRVFDLEAAPVHPYAQLYHDENCEVYINGKRVLGLEGYTVQYTLAPLSDSSALRAGQNSIAVHCHQTTGGQGIDVGLIDLQDGRDK